MIPNEGILTDKAAEWLRKSFLKQGQNCKILLVMILTLRMESVGLKQNADKKMAYQFKISHAICFCSSRRSVKELIVHPLNLLLLFFFSQRFFLLLQLNILQHCPHFILQTKDDLYLNSNLNSRHRLPVFHQPAIEMFVRFSAFFSYNFLG